MALRYRTKVLEKVYNSFGLTTHKCNNHYSKEVRYRQFVDAMSYSLKTGSNVKQFEYMAKYIEQFTVADFNLLCELAEGNRLSGLCLVLDIIVNQPCE